MDSITTNNTAKITVLENNQKVVNSNEYLQIQVIFDTIKKKFTIPFQNLSIKTLMSLLERTVKIQNDFIFNNHRVYYDEIIDHDKDLFDYNELSFDEQELKNNDDEWFSLEIETMKFASKKNLNGIFEIHPNLRLFIVEKSKVFDPIAMKQQNIRFCPIISQNQDNKVMSQQTFETLQKQNNTNNKIISQQTFETLQEQNNTNNKVISQQTFETSREQNNIDNNHYENNITQEQNNLQKQNIEKVKTQEQSFNGMSDDDKKTYIDMVLTDEKVLDKLWIKYKGDTAELVQKYFEEVGYE